MYGKGVGCRAVVTGNTPGVTGCVGWVTCNSPCVTGYSVTTCHVCWVDDDDLS